MKKKKTVFVAMSGGVDSSVAAALLKKAGFSVTGVFMKPWSRFASSGSSTSKSRIRDSQSESGQPFECLWKQDREDALRVAVKLDISLLTWDFSKEYEKRVAGYMIDGYRNGITPNPDVMCNKFIKFGIFLEQALKAGADYIATGHYVRIEVQAPRGSYSARSFSGAPAAPSEGVGRFVPLRGNRAKTASESARRTTPARLTYYKLLKAKDENKDQSYFLYTLTQKQLKHCLFPIGDYTKDEVRKIARKFGLPNWGKKDSQGVCFVGPLDFGEFLKKYIKPQRGIIIRKSDGKILGSHDGACYYTIGQRHGFGLNGGQSYYVVEKDVKKNILYVDEEVRNKKLDVRIQDFNWISGHNRLPLDCKVKTRYRQQDLDCVVVKNGEAAAEVKIKAENIVVAPGQSAVFYKGSEVLGGGVIQ